MHSTCLIIMTLLSQWTGGLHRTLLIGLLRMSTVLCTMRRSRLTQGFFFSALAVLRKFVTTHRITFQDGVWHYKMLSEIPLYCSNGALVKYACTTYAISIGVRDIMRVHYLQKRNWIPVKMLTPCYIHYTHFQGINNMMCPIIMGHPICMYNNSNSFVLTFWCIQNMKKLDGYCGYYWHIHL